MVLIQRSMNQMVANRGDYVMIQGQLRLLHRLSQFDFIAWNGGPSSKQLSRLLFEQFKHVYSINSAQQ